MMWRTPGFLQVQDIVEQGTGLYRRQKSSAFHSERYNAHHHSSAHAVLLMIELFTPAQVFKRIWKLHITNSFWCLNSVLHTIIIRIILQWSPVINARQLDDNKTLWDYNHNIVSIIIRGNPYPARCIPGQGTANPRRKGRPVLVPNRARAESSACRSSWCCHSPQTSKCKIL